MFWFNVISVNNAIERQHCFSPFAETVNLSKMD